MDKTTLTPLETPHIVKGDALLIFGLAQRMESNAGIPSQWSRFLPHFGHIPGQIGRVAYGVIHNADDSGAYDYLCGVQVREFPVEPSGFTGLRIPPQTYIVFAHRDHVSAIANTWKAIREHGIAEAGYRAGGGPAFERYGENFNSRTGLGDMEIWVPVKI